MTLCKSGTSSQKTFYMRVLHKVAHYWGCWASRTYVFMSLKQLIRKRCPLINRKKKTDFGWGWTIIHGCQLGDHYIVCLCLSLYLCMCNCKSSFLIVVKLSWQLENHKWYEDAAWLGSLEGYLQDLNLIQNCFFSLVLAQYLHMWPSARVDQRKRWRRKDGRT